MAALSTNDSHVLNALFDPESSLSSGARIDASQRPLPNINEDTFYDLQEQEARILKPLAVEKPDASSIRTAIEALTELITHNPSYASAYSNRAQANRMLLGDRLHSSSNVQETQSSLDSVIQDLSIAITLATPDGLDAPVSLVQQKILSSAYTHRAYIFYTIAKSEDLSCLPERYQAIGAERLEELASSDFQMGGRYGNSIAQQMSVRTNPYAKMCGAIVKEALRKEMDAQPAISAPLVP